jgi:hypothetical protein
VRRVETLSEVDKSVCSPPRDRRILKQNGPANRRDFEATKKGREVRCRFRRTSAFGLRCKGLDLRSLVCRRECVADERGRRLMKRMPIAQSPAGCQHSARLAHTVKPAVESRVWGGAKNRVELRRVGSCWSPTAIWRFERDLAGLRGVDHRRLSSFLRSKRGNARPGPIAL